MQLATLRAAAGLAQAALAEKAGCSTEFVSRIERGKALPSVLTLMQLCDALDCTPDDLLLVPESRRGSPTDRLSKRLRIADPELRERATWVAEAVLAYGSSLPPPRARKP